MNGDQLLTAEQVADLLQVPKTSIYSETRAGRLPHVTLGRYRRYRRSAINAWVEGLEQQATASTTYRRHHPTQGANA